MEARVGVLTKHFVHITGLRIDRGKLLCLSAKCMLAEKCVILPFKITEDDYVLRRIFSRKIF